jgi:hypothetical protein
MTTGREADYLHDDTKEEDLEIWTVKGSTRFKGVEQHIVSQNPAVLGMAQ